MNHFNIDNIQSAVVVGAGHGIGLACVKALLEEHIVPTVFAVYRDRVKSQQLIDLEEDYPERLKIFQFDMTKEEDVKSFFSVSLKDCSAIDLLINSIGFLKEGVVQPEKNLSQISPENLLEYFRVNALVTPMLAKYSQKFFSKDNVSVFITLSAKVGSIQDNALGGWYGYRASKAALNMFIKNISLEFLNKRLGCVVMSYHPGTTNTDLSAPYIQRTKLKVHDSDTSAQNLMRNIQNLTIEQSGIFLSWNGEVLPW